MKSYEVPPVRETDEGVSLTIKLLSFGSTTGGEGTEDSLTISTKFLGKIPVAPLLSPLGKKRKIWLSLKHTNT